MLTPQFCLPDRITRLRLTTTSVRPGMSMAGSPDRMPGSCSEGFGARAVVGRKCRGTSLCATTSQCPSRSRHQRGELCCTFAPCPKCLYLGEAARHLPPRRLPSLGISSSSRQCRTLVERTHWVHADTHVVLSVGGNLDSRAEDPALRDSDMLQSFAYGRRAIKESLSAGWTNKASATIGRVEHMLVGRTWSRCVGAASEMV